MYKIHHSDSVNPYENLAFEEYLMQTGSPGEEILYLWQNEKTVVIGRNQNPWKECNLEELDKIGGTLVRRLSGGGAVYHDGGNLNFTFISATLENKVQENVAFIVSVLKKLGVKAEFSGKNDILAEGFKVSGNAFFEENGLLCHHGTLLVDTDVSMLAKVLTVSRLKLESKGIDSVKGRVKNLKELGNQGELVTVEALKRMLSEEFQKKYQDLGEMDFVVDTGRLEGLKKRFESEDWNFGSTPEFNVTQVSRTESGEVELCLQVMDGFIRGVKVHTDSLDLELPVRLTRALMNTRFRDRCL